MSNFVVETNQNKFLVQTNALKYYVQVSIQKTNLNVSANSNIVNASFASNNSVVVNRNYYELQLTSPEIKYVHVSTASIFNESSSFERISKNLSAYPYSINYSGDNISTIVYTLPSGTITKTFNYSGDNLSSIVLSGDVPSGIQLTKTFNYTGENLTSVAYS